MKRIIPVSPSSQHNWVRLLNFGQDEFCKNSDTVEYYARKILSSVRILRVRILRKKVRTNDLVLIIGFILLSAVGAFMIVNHVFKDIKKFGNNFEWKEFFISEKISAAKKNSIWMIVIVGCFYWYLTTFIDTH